ncbi:antibiotic biosynthesis monooxygenase [Aggregatibacter actinomycetemcomitans]|uniref:putative quinol monooxygenase n=1 Tax=Aggregatibacter actinomycetemcomitans TaxID=714 RepID=UPI00197B4D64|nr:antibiotic biosynthesis monooxygenase [Aggregatibacter actinomycetemcomitans]MBN6070214.1 antibiotic biosynthesis monooxygenase [Aggregatibacter actinomycetemcomitans]
MKKLTALLGVMSMAMTAQAAPIINLFELGIQPGKNVQYDAVGEQNIKTSMQTEKGTLAMHSVKQKADANMAYMVEIYADQNAYEIHRTSPQYKAFLTTSPEILTDHKKRTLLTPQFLGDKKVEQTANTRTNLVMVEVKPSENDKFKAIVLPEMTQSLKVEDGVIAMYAATAQENPNKWMFFEIYANDDAYAAHRETPHFKDYLKQTAEMLVDKQIIEIQPTYLGNKGGLQFEKP